MIGDLVFRTAIPNLKRGGNQARVPPRPGPAYRVALLLLVALQSTRAVARPHAIPGLLLAQRLARPAPLRLTRPPWRCAAGFQHP